MEQKSTFWKAAMTYGLYLGIALVVYDFILYSTGQNMNKWLSWISTVIMIAGIFYFQVRYRDKELGGTIKYSTALGFGVATILFAGIIHMVYFVTIMKVDPSFFDNLRATQEEVMLQQGLPEDQIEMVAGMMSTMQSPALMAIGGILGNILYGFIISLITSIFVKKDDGQNAYDRAMEEVQKEE